MNDKSNERNKIIVNNIKTLATQRGTNIAAIERELIIGNGTIGKWAKAAKSPPYETLYKIATYFGVTVADLTDSDVDKEQKNHPVTSADRMNPDYLKLNAANRAAIDAAIAAFLASQKSED